jgi:hypothetical protein
MFPLSRTWNLKALPEIETKFGRPLDELVAIIETAIMKHALTLYREDHGMTLKAFGQLVAADKSQVWKWENGSIPRPAQMQRIYEVTKGEINPSDWYATEAAE